MVVQVIVPLLTFSGRLVGTARGLLQGANLARVLVSLKGSYEDETRARIAALAFRVPVLELGVSFDARQLRRELDRLKRDLADTAVSRGLNRTIEQVRTEVNRQIRAQYESMRAAEIRDRLRIRRARRGDLTAELTVDGRRRSLNLQRFIVGGGKLTQANARRKLGAGTRAELKVRIKRGKAPKNVPLAFVANDGRTVFRRVGKERFPIEPVQTIGVPQMFNARTVITPTLERARDLLARNIQREADFLVKRFNARR